MPRVQIRSFCQRLRRPTPGTRRWRTLPIATALFVIMVAPPGAQTRSAPHLSEDPTLPMIGDEIELLVGRSTVLTLDRPITRVALSTEEIAAALVTSSRQVLIHGKSPGTISLLVWGASNEILSYDVTVRRDLSPLQEQFSQLFPTEQIDVASNGTDVVISGTVATKYVVDKAAAVAAGYVENPENVVNLLRQQEGLATNQIMLRVRFAEVSRSALQELGSSFFTGVGGSGNWVARGTTQQFPAPDFDAENGLVFSDFLNIFAFHTGENIGAVLKLLENKGLFQSLAEPDLITQNGKEATFLAGGEYPYPVLQGTGSNAGITIMFKEFGVRLQFTPTIVGDDLIHLAVAPEVSALDFSNAITLEGFRVPSLTTRRTSTEVELRDGQTFAIAGLMDNTVTETMSKIPGLGDIPILGYLFQSRAYQKNQTELVVMITPHIIRRDSTGVSPTLPGLIRPFLQSEDEMMPPPPPYPQGVSRALPPEADDLADNDLSSGTLSAPAAADALIGTATATSGARSAVIEAEEASPVAASPNRRAVEAARPTKAELKAEAKARMEAAKVARARAKREKEAADQLAKRLEAERKVDAKARMEAEKVARARAKLEKEAAERLAEAERKAEAKAAKEAEELARETAKREKEAAERFAKAEGKRLEAERKVEAKAAKEAEELARETAKREKEAAERFAKAEGKRLEAERKAEAKARMEAEKVARARAKREKEAADQLAKRLEEERKAEAKARMEAEKVARARAKREKEEAERLAKVERKNAEGARKRADELEQEREERQAELQKILAEYLTRINEAQRAGDELDSERSQLVIPLNREQP